MPTAARAAVGTPYGSGGNGPSSFDCSGLTVHAFKQAGVSLPRTSFAQYGQGSRIDRSQIQAGDLVFFGPDGKRTKRGHISHVGIALGGGWMIHSSGSRGGVSISNLETYWTEGTAFARRPPAFAAPAARTPV